MFASLFSLFVGIASLLSGAVVLSISQTQRGVFDPIIISPNASTVWAVGTQVNVTWITSNAPQVISNEGLVILDKDGLEVSSGPGSVGALPFPISFSVLFNPDTGLFCVR